MYDNCPDFKEKFEKNEVKNYKEYLRIYVLKENEPFGNYEEMTKEELLEVIKRRRQTFTTVSRQFSDNDTQINLMSQLLNQMNPNVAQIIELLVFFKVTNVGVLDKNKLYDNQISATVLETLLSCKNELENSEVMNADRSYLLD